MALSLSIAVPVKKPLLYMGIHYDECIEELKCLSSKIHFCDGYFKNSQMEIAFYESPENYPHFPKLEINWGDFFTSDHYSLLVISPKGDDYERLVFEKIQEDLKKQNIDDETDGILKYELASALKFELFNFLLCANIAYPGSLSTNPGNTFIDDQKYNSVDGFYALDMEGAVTESKRLNWPPFADVSILQTYNWLKNSKAFDIGVSTNPVGRAIAALSHVTVASPQHKEYFDLSIVWCLLGLEGLYCHGNSGLREQLVTKTELLLGERQENKKAFGALYDFRSRLLHGDVDVPLRYTDSDATPQFDRFVTNLYGCEHLALAALLATLQLMIKNNWVELRFPYSVQGVKLNSNNADS